ncbi:helicase-related protein [uncultured Pseudokineococcus sp.]|uniref:helicase-related protein n=1 Tax=uncultured Pseudokineococcus sp. TaxID=1642928 RepID=UPI0026106333|nr:helicase-related protein [uncultured Pseudokineococcus sp.]
MSRDLDPWYRARDAMRRALEADLQGTSEETVLHEKPLDRYIVGVLRPRESAVVIDETSARVSGDANPSIAVDPADGGQDTAGVVEDGPVDAGVALARMRHPSSMGVTVAVDPRTTPELRVTVTADRYLQPVDAPPAAPSPGEVTEESAGASEDVVADEHAGADAQASTSKEGDRGSKRWVLQSIGPRSVTVPTSIVKSHCEDIEDGLLGLRVIVRKPVDGAVSITAVLVNVADQPARGGADEVSVFRPRLHLEVEAGHFLGRTTVRDGTALSADEASTQLLFRDKASLAIGHGCSVTWEGGSAPVTAVSSTFIPHEDVRVSRAERADVPVLSMRDLSATDDRTSLFGLVEAYESWIEEQAVEAARLDEENRVVAERHLATARQAASRMRAGIEAVEADPAARQAFRVMNGAMQEQRSRQEMIRARLSAPPDRDQTWRPFQMAFVLMNLEGLVDETSDDRDVADLLWFPTGGGKTEAYLGLVAFVIALRRLRAGAGAGAGGVAVLMRYTLRLLTVQQFERAAGLICALEMWRRRELPAAPLISIGLWVGQGSTPNKVKDAEAALRKTRSTGEDGDEGNPRQLLTCPWCGADLPVESYVVSRRPDKLTVECSNRDCDFRPGLPVHVVDSDVYDARPSLVIGTVDKFAMLAWNERAGVLFGRGSDDLPPDLIIQDELHLISGPLGTLVGLYEMAVDEASSRVVVGEDGDRAAVRPKLVASTATIRRAEAQVRAVFARTSAQFPPPGLTPDDSFFAVTAPAEERATRQYVGVMAPGSSHATLLVRTYAALLQGAEALEDDDEVKDAYWTLLGYFNSLRVLGSAYIQAIDDVPDRVKVVADRLGQTPRDLSAVPRELTSRKRSSEIPRELEALGTSLPDPDAPNVVLATNMISVGVDVDRLGLMVAMGQPQTTSEYIQATSRVGRAHPGLVVTLYNAARSRDLSHYESFTSYHRALYRQVEATGATPFAPRAVDRGLHGVLAAMTRLLVAGGSPEGAVGALRTDQAVDRLRQVVVERVRAVQPEEAERVEDSFDELVDRWRYGVEHGGVRQYSGWRSREGALLVPAGQRIKGSEGPDTFPVEDPAWPTLTSLRNVDSESSLYLAMRRRKRG